MVRAEMAAREALANALVGFVDYGDRDFMEFSHEVLEDFMAREPSEFVPLADFHEEWGNTIEANTYTGIICARGHLKTSFCLSYLLYQMATQPNFRALYIAATLEQAYNKLEQLEEMCLRSWRLRGQIQDTIGTGGGWRKGAKYFKNGSRVQAASVGKALEGPHTHLIILDDILEEFPRMVDDKVIHYIKRVVLPMRLPNGRVFLIGTQKRIGDATEWVRESPEWATLWHPALLEDGTPRWPEYWSLERLEAEKQVMGSRAFESEYLLNPIDPESAVIPWSVLDSCLNRKGEVATAPKPGWLTFMGVDLAVGLDRVHDETAYCVLAYNPTSQEREVLYCWNGKVQGEGSAWLKAQVDNIARISGMFKPEAIMVESNGFQRLVAHAARDVENLPVKSHHTGNEKNHSQIGIPGIAVQMEKGLYSIPFGEAAAAGSRPGTADLVRGLSGLMWGGHGKLEGHTPDPVVALWMSELAVQDYEKNQLNVGSWDWL
jgi:hypothetical protein